MPDRVTPGNPGENQSQNLEARITEALSSIAFDPAAPAQSRVAALKELRAMLDGDRAGQNASKANALTDPGTLTLDAIDRELSGG